MWWERRRRRREGESKPTPFLMDVWGCQECPDTIRAMNAPTYSKRFKEVCLGSRCLIPLITSEREEVLGCIQLEQYPYLLSPFNPSACR